MTSLNPLTGTLKPQTNGPLYSDTAIGTLAVNGWTVTFGTARRGLGGLRPTHQQPVQSKRLTLVSLPSDCNQQNRRIKNSHSFTQCKKANGSRSYGYCATRHAAWNELLDGVASTRQKSSRTTAFRTWLVNDVVAHVITWLSASFINEKLSCLRKTARCSVSFGKFLKGNPMTVDSESWINCPNCRPRLRPWRSSAVNNVGLSVSSTSDGRTALTTSTMWRKSRKMANSRFCGKVKAAFH